MKDPDPRLVGAGLSTDAAYADEQDCFARREPAVDTDQGLLSGMGDRLRWGRSDVAPSRRWAGLPERRSRALALMLIAALMLGAAAGAVADRFVSPAQIAARARSPAASLITAPVRFGVLPELVQVQATASIGKTVTVDAPSDLAGSLPVVTSVAVAAGQQVTAGRLLATVADRPVFVFAGTIPAFRAMSPGVSGPDVAELQQGLAAAGYGTGGDAAGMYGPGTAAAVAALYQASGVMPVMSPRSGQARALSRQVKADQAAASTAGAKLAADRRAGAHHDVLAADRATLAAAKAALTAADRDLASALRLAGATVPLGEVTFVPQLPTRAVSVARLGSTIGAGSSASSVALLATGRATLTATAGSAQAGSLRAGMTGIAVSDVSGAQLAVRVSAVRGLRVTFVPAMALPANMAGQNLLVTIKASQVKALIVPVAAVSTSESGQTFVTVSRRGGTTQVAVRLGLASGGEQAVSATRRGTLRPGDLVVLGVSAAGSR